MTADCVSFTFRGLNIVIRTHVTWEELKMYVNKMKTCLEYVGRLENNIILFYPRGPTSSYNLKSFFISWYITSILVLI